MPTTLAGQGGHSGVGQPQGARVCGVRVEDPDSSIVILKNKTNIYEFSYNFIYLSCSYKVTLSYNSNNVTHGSHYIK